MFGEYAQVASYMQPARAAAYQRDAFHNELPSYLTPTFHPPQPWDQKRTKSGLGPGEDFIMIAEFSELEGPKPLMTIPNDGGANFDQNFFAVRILAVDHHNPAEGFSISEDTQIVVTDAEAGIFAFVHHLVLFDNTARGFVRPYCIAFITAEQRKLMYFYEELSWKFKKVARFLKYGNKMVFVGDLERHLRDLEHTKNVFLNQVCKIRLRSSEGPEDQITDARKNAENELYRGLETIRQSSEEIKDILSVLKPLLPDRRLEARFRILEDRAYQGYSSVGVDKLSLPESGFTDFISGVDELDFRYGSLSEPRISPLALFKPREYRPVLVETKKAKRFNAPLRGLHELCSWGAKEGLRKLRHIHMYFKRDMAVLELHKNESRLFRPCSTSIYHGQCITGNFLSGVQMKKSLDATEEAELNWSMLYSHQWSSLGSLVSEDSFKSADSFPSGNDHYDASPSSFHTYDSLSCNIFQSASASPEKEFSLLMSNEYYPDLKTSQEKEMTYTESKVSHDFFQNEKTTVSGDVARIFMGTNDEFSQKHIRSSSWDENSLSEKVTFCVTNIKNSLQSGNRALLNENDGHQKGSMSDSDHLSSCTILDMKVREMNDNNFINNESMIENERSKCSSKSEVLDMNVEYPFIKDDELKYKMRSLNSENGDGVSQGQGEYMDDCLADMTIQNRNDFSIFADKDLIVRNGRAVRSDNASGLALSAEKDLIAHNVQAVRSDNAFGLALLAEKDLIAHNVQAVRSDNAFGLALSAEKDLITNNVQAVRSDNASGLALSAEKDLIARNGQAVRSVNASGLALSVDKDLIARNGQAARSDNACGLALSAEKDLITNNCQAVRSDNAFGLALSAEKDLITNNCQAVRSDNAFGLALSAEKDLITNNCQAVRSDNASGLALSVDKDLIAHNGQAVRSDNASGLALSVDKDLIAHNGQIARSVNASGLALSADTCYSIASVDDEIDNNISLNSAQSLSESLQCSSSESTFTLDGDVYIGEENQKLLPRNLKPASQDGLLSAEENPLPVLVDRELIIADSTTQSQHCNSSLSAKMEQGQKMQREEDKVNTLNVSSLQVNEFHKNGSEIPLQNGSAIPPQNGSKNPQNDSEMPQIDYKNSCSDSEVPQNGSENCHTGSIIPLQCGSENNHNLSEFLHNEHDIFQYGSEMSINYSEMSQNATENSQNVFEIQQNDYGSRQDSVTSSHKSPSESSPNDKPENKFLSETNSLQGTHGYKGKTASSKLSHSLMSDSRHDHHITRVTRLRGEKSSHPGLHNGDDLGRARTESDVSSAYTEISIRDLFPRLNSSDNESKDGALYEGCEAAIVNNEQIDIPTSQSMMLWKPRCGAYTVGDWINNLSQARPGFGLSEVLLTYQCLDHVIFSLLCGRPVLVAGPARMESEIIKIVNALAVFVPVVRRKSQAVLEWTSKPLKITDLIKLKLIGVCRPERRSLDSFVPSTIKKACTVVDIEKRTIVAPPYQGHFIPALMSKKNILRSDVQLLAYIEWWLMGILAKAFILFHSFCLGSSGSVLYSQSPKDQRDAYHVIVSGIMDRLGVKDCDCEILENLTEMVKLTKMECGIWQGVDSGCVVSPLTLKHLTCDKFSC